MSELPKHYDILGVAPEASMAEIKRAYLRAARSAHPDLNNATEQARTQAEARMRSINQSWAVLSDPDERAYYDRQRLQRLADTPPTAGPRHHRARHSGAGFRPFDDGDEPDFDENDDRPITDSALPQWLAIGPAALLVGGFVAILFGAIVGAGSVMSLGIISMVVSGVLFLVAAPIVALGRAIRGERRG